MKIIKTASGKKKIKISKSEWKSIGRKAGWEKQNPMIENPMIEEMLQMNADQTDIYKKLVKTIEKSKGIVELKGAKYNSVKNDPAATIEDKKKAKNFFIHSLQIHKKNMSRLKYYTFMVNNYDEAITESDLTPDNVEIIDTPSGEIEVASPIMSPQTYEGLIGDITSYESEIQEQIENEQMEDLQKYQKVKMKITKTASGKKIKMSKSEWTSIGKQAGWDFDGTPSEELEYIDDAHGLNDRALNVEKTKKIKQQQRLLKRKRPATPKKPKPMA